MVSTSNEILYKQFESYCNYVENNNAISLDDLFNYFPTEDLRGLLEHLKEESGIDMEY